MRLFRAALVAIAQMIPLTADAQWTVITATDRLDPKVKFIYAVAPAKQPFQQLGRPVFTKLEVFCSQGMTTDGTAKTFKQLGVRLDFSERVSIGERYIRWRVDQHPVSWTTQDFFNDGKLFYVSSTIGRSELPGQLSTGKLMLVEASLPWAGNTLIEFDVSGGKDAFSKVPCSGTLPKP